MQVAEYLIEFKRIGDSSKPKDKRGKPTRGGGEKEKPSKEFPPKPTFEKGKFRGNTNGGGDRPKKLACYFCGDPHKAMDCPKRANLAALVQREEEKQPEETRLHSLRLLNAIKAKVDERPRGAMFVKLSLIHI